MFTRNTIPMETQKKVRDILAMLATTSHLKFTRRYGSSLKKKADTSAAHSWQLAFAAYSLVTEFSLSLDSCKCLGLALVHDLPEVYTGDKDAVDILNGKVRRKEKNEAEASCMRNFNETFISAQSFYDLWEEYKEQKTLEAKFVNALDKLESFIHLNEHGIEDYTLDVFHSYYPASAVKSFCDAFQSEEPVGTLFELLKEELKIKYEKRGVQWKE